MGRLAANLGGPSAVMLKNNLFEGVNDEKYYTYCDFVGGRM